MTFYMSLTIIMIGTIFPINESPTAIDYFRSDIFGLT